MALISTGMMIVRTGTITLPAGLAKVMYNIYHTTPKRFQGDEFGLYMKGEWDQETGSVHVADDLFYIPLQTVSPAFIRFDEDPPDPSWNVVIHRHPQGVRRFSSEDDRSINQEFLASMLFMPDWEFPDAIINVPVSDGFKIQIPAKVEVVGSFFEGLEELIGTAAAKIRHGNNATKGEAAALAASAAARAPARIGEVKTFVDGGSCEVVGEADPVAARPHQLETAGFALAREAALQRGRFQPLRDLRHGRRQPGAAGGRLTEQDLREIGLGAALEQAAAGDGEFPF